MKRHPGGQEQTRRMLALAALPEGASVLDLGAGDGESVRLLRELGYRARGIDLAPRGEEVERGDLLRTGLPEGSFDAVLSQCAFHVSGDMAGAFRESCRLLRPGGALLYADVFPGDPTSAAKAAGFHVEHAEELTPLWREYYLEALWRGDAEYCPGQGRMRYWALICRKEETMDLFDRILELSRCGYFCGQILAILLLDTLGEEDPGFVRAMGGLNGGVGFSGGMCGCMSGGACVISYLTGKGEDAGLDHPEHKSALGEFTKWFDEEAMIQYGGIDCRDITRGNPAKRVELCPGLIADTYQKCMEILSEKTLL